MPIICMIYAYYMHDLQYFTVYGAISPKNSLVVQLVYMQYIIVYVTITCIMYNISSYT